MSERIDHAEKARTELDFLHAWMGEEGSTEATQLASVHEAQVHATLALVEQQRIANILTLVSLHAANADALNRYPGLFVDIKEALGLS
jgi:hypothetical protein